MTRSMRFGSSVCLSVVVGTMALLGSAFAQDGSEADLVDNSGKFGIGFQSRFPLSCISVKYWTPGTLGLQGVVTRAGMSVSYDELSASLTSVSGRLLLTVRRQSNARFYLAGGVSYTDAVVKDEWSKSGASGLGLEGVGGVEYSLKGLPNLGLAFEFGIAFTRFGEPDSDDTVDIHFTPAGTVGVHYYFLPDVHTSCAPISYTCLNERLALCLERAAARSRPFRRAVSHRWLLHTVGPASWSRWPGHMSSASARCRRSWRPVGLCAIMGPGGVGPLVGTEREHW